MVKCNSSNVPRPVIHCGHFHNKKLRYRDGLSPPSCQNDMVQVRNPAGNICPEQVWWTTYVWLTRGQENNRFCMVGKKNPEEFMEQLISVSLMWKHLSKKQRWDQITDREKIVCNEQWWKIHFSVVWFWGCGVGVSLGAEMGLTGLQQLFQLKDIFVMWSYSTCLTHCHASF